MKICASAALSSIDAEHSSDNGAYIRSIYPRLDTPRLKAAAIRARRAHRRQRQRSMAAFDRAQSERARRCERNGAPLRRALLDSDRAIWSDMYDVAGDRPLREQLITSTRSVRIRRQPTSSCEIAKDRHRSRHETLRDLGALAQERSAEPNSFYWRSSTNDEALFPTRDCVPRRDERCHISGDAQSLANRVAGASDRSIQFSYPARAGRLR